MKLYEITLRPESPFGTPLKGDTLFGHVCWQAAYDPDLLSGGLAHWISLYETRPFAVLSTAWPKFRRGGKSWYAMKRPDLPLSLLFKDDGSNREARLLLRKERQSMRWVEVPENLSLDLKCASYLGDSDLGCRISRNEKPAAMTEEMLQTHNTINRLSQRTGPGPFAPFSETSIHYAAGTELAVFVYLDPEATTFEKMSAALGLVGRFGFGRDASTGRGRFAVSGWSEVTIPDREGCSACYLLGPAVPERGAFREVFFSPFVRFGKLGDTMARSGNPFKAPVIMADEGAVLVPREPSVFEKPFVGTAVTGISKASPEAVAQGYACYLPIKLEI